MAYLVVAVISGSFGTTLEWMSGDYTIGSLILAYVGYGCIGTAFLGILEVMFSK